LRNFWCGPGLLLLLCVGCTPPVSSVHTPPTPLVVVATPEVVAARLHPVPALEEAAGQLADALGVPGEQVRVRMQIQGCMTCTAKQNSVAASLTGLAVADAIPQLEAGATLWLFVQNFTCQYTFDGTTFTPKHCQFGPV
jgi:hypothetical protein